MAKDHLTYSFPCWALHPDPYDPVNEVGTVSTWQVRKLRHRGEGGPTASERKGLGLKTTTPQSKMVNPDSYT